MPIMNDQMWQTCKQIQLLTVFNNKNPVLLWVKKVEW